MISRTIPPSQEDLYELENACTTHPFNSGARGKILRKRCKNKKFLDLGRRVALETSKLYLLGVSGRVRRGVIFEMSGYG